MMKAMPLTAGSASRSFLQASSPPAEAPIATMGKPARPLMEGGSGIQRGRFAPTVCWRLPGILQFFSKSNAPRERAKTNSRIRERLRTISTVEDSP